MGGRGGSSGLGNMRKTPQFEGTEKQVKWANDIISSSKKFLENDLKENYSGEKAERQKIIVEISNNVLSNAAQSMSAKEVIDSRDVLDPKQYARMLPNESLHAKALHLKENFLGFSVLKDGTIRIRDSKTGKYKDSEYNLESIKRNKKEQKSLENELIQNLKKKK